MIIFASGRTDIPAFYSSWFMNRYKEGYVDVRNPFRHEIVSRLYFSDCDLIQFCSKNPLPLIPHLKEITQPIVFHVTLTPYKEDIEPGVKDKSAIIEGIKDGTIDAIATDNAPHHADEKVCEYTGEDILYVLTNSSRVNGAACILYDNLLKKFANDVHSDLYILPSSVHEVIIVPKKNAFDKSELADMVREVNEQGVSQDEILSDNVYEYNRKNGLITM